MTAKTQLMSSCAHCAHQIAGISLRSEKASPPRNLSAPENRRSRSCGASCGTFGRIVYSTTLKPTSTRNISRNTFDRPAFARMKWFVARRISEREGDRELFASQMRTERIELAMRLVGRLVERSATEAQRVFCAAASPVFMSYSALEKLAAD